MSVCLYLHIVYHSYTPLAKMPDRFSMEFKSGILANQSKSFTELASNHECDAQDIWQLTLSC